MADPEFCDGTICLPEMTTPDGPIAEACERRYRSLTPGESGASRAVSKSASSSYENLHQRFAEYRIPSVEFDVRRMLGQMGSFTGKIGGQPNAGIT